MALSFPAVVRSERRIHLSTVVEKQLRSSLISQRFITATVFLSFFKKKAKRLKLHTFLMTLLPLVASFLLSFKSNPNPCAID